jgi:hypothetical protein
VRVLVGSREAPLEDEVAVWRLCLLTDRSRFGVSAGTIAGYAYGFEPDSTATRFQVTGGSEVHRKIYQPGFAAEHRHPNTDSLKAELAGQRAAHSGKNVN